MAERNARAPDDGPVDPLEAELAAFRPPPPSPLLARRIAGRLEAGEAAGRRPRRPAASLGVLAAAAAACAALAVGLWRAPRGGPGDSRRPDVTAIASTSPATTRAAADFADPWLPTPRAYERAFADSPEAFDALLALRPGGAGHPPSSAPPATGPARAFARRLSVGNPLTGELQ
jgi:hypothetical protein